MMSYSPTLRTIVSEDGAAILDIERNSISTLNPTGAFVWQGLQRGERLEVIIANLADETGENVAVVERDVQAFIQDLQQKHLAAR